MKKNKIFVSLVTATLVLNFLSPLPADGQAAASYDASKAVQYLKSGNIDEWTVMALAASGGLSGVNTSFLQSDAGSSATAIEKRILAGVAAGANAQSHVTALAALYNGTEINAAGNLLNDDIWGLLAFAAAGVNQTAQAQLATFIKQNQNSDGGWGFAKAPTSSDSNDTAMAIMALLSARQEGGQAGESPSSSIISKGFDFLAGALSTGFAFDKNFGPDAASTSWAISAYAAAGKIVPQSARIYLESLQKPDGSFSWQTGGSGSAQMTAYAMIALSGKFYPIRGTAAPANSNFVVSVSVIGPQASIFQGSVALPSATALSSLVEAAKVGGFTYAVKDTSLGVFVESIAGIGPSGSKGWMYAVNGVKPSVGAAQYNLQNGDKVIWFYGEPGDLPPVGGAATAGGSVSVNLSVNVSVPVDPEPTVSLTASRTSIQLGDTVQLSWSSQHATNVVTSNPGNFAGAALSGSVVVQPAQTTIYSILVSGPGGTKQATVQINVDTTPQIVFGVSTNNVNLGGLNAPNAAAQGSLSITNYGQNRIEVTATLQSADGLYQQALFLNGLLWSSFRETLVANISRNVNLSLVLPAGYKNNGMKTGTLIFWAKPQ